MNLSKKNAEMIDETFIKMKRHMPELRMINSVSGIEIFDGKKQIHNFEGAEGETVYAIMAFFLGVSSAFRSDPTLKTLLKNL